MIDYDEPAIERQIKTEVYRKAVSGAGASGWLYQRQLQAISASPQKLAMQAQALYRDHAIVNEVERQVSGRGSSVLIHLEDGDDNTIDDESSPQLQAIRDLIEKPQALIDDIAASQKMTRRTLWRITLRHAGLCGTAFWYFDQGDALAGIPLGILYINPARMFDVNDPNGNLLGWTLDGPPGQGTPLELDSVLPFYLDPPDFGHFGIGLAESIWTKAQLNELADKHEANTLQGGGRLAGIISPKDQQSGITDDNWRGFINDWRGIVEDPNSARRLQIVQGPIEYTRTSATMQELAVVDISKLSAEDIQAHWGVPPSQTGRSGPAGLNSGTTKGYDEATLWQGAIHPRLQMMYETIQYGLLDRFAKLGQKVELEIEEPEFDDSGPAFELAQRAIFLPMTNAERRDLIGLSPLGDPSMDNAILMPTTTFLWATAPDENGDPVANLTLPGNVVDDLQAQVNVLQQATAAVGGIATTPNKVMPTKVAAGAQSTGNVTPLAALVPPGKAAVTKRPLLNLRASIDRTVTPQIRSAVATVLAAQKADVIAKIKRHYDHITKKPSDSGVWWNGARWNADLKNALAPHVEVIAGKVAAGLGRAMPKLVPAKAAPVAFHGRVVKRVLDRGAARITGINETTRDGIAAIIADPANDTLGSLVTAIESFAGFDEYRSEMIARTESMDAYNAASISSYDEFGIEEVEAIDGDGDPECAERDGQTYGIDEADSIEDHPNGTLDWIPVIPDEPAKAVVSADLVASLSDAAVKAQNQLDMAMVMAGMQSMADAHERGFNALAEVLRNQPPTMVSIPDWPAFPTVPAPNVSVAAPQVNITAAPVDFSPLTDALAIQTDALRQKDTVKDVQRDAKGNISRVIETVVE